MMKQNGQLVFEGNWKDDFPEGQGKYVFFQDDWFY